VNPAHETFEGVEAGVGGGQALGGCDTRTA
jgi:hypothetical protein